MKVDKTSKGSQRHIKSASQLTTRNQQPAGLLHHALQHPPHQQETHRIAHIRWSENTEHACSPLERASISRTD